MGKVRKVLLSIFLCIVFIPGVHAASEWSSAGGGFANVGTGNASNGIAGGCDTGCNLYDTFGLRVSLVQGTKDNYKVLTSRDYYNNGKGWTRDGRGKWNIAVKLANPTSRNYHGSRLEAIEKQGNQTWRTVRASSSAFKSHIVSSKGTKWLKSGTGGGANYEDDFTEASNLFKAMRNNPDKIREYITSNKQVKVTSGKKTYYIHGLNYDLKELPDCSDTSQEYFLIIEPMIGIRYQTYGSSSQPVDMLGTVTEIAYFLSTHNESGASNSGYCDNWTNFMVTPSSDITYRLDKNEKFGNKSTIRFNLLKASGDSISQSCYQSSGNGHIDDFSALAPKLNGGKVSDQQAWGMNWLWIGQVSDYCNEPDCYDYSVSYQTPACSADETNNKVTLAETYKKGTCVNKTTRQKYQYQSIGTYNQAFSDSMGSEQNFCKMYCKDSVQIIYPKQYETKIKLDPSGRLDNYLIWPNDKTEDYQLKVIGKRVCQYLVDGNGGNLSKCASSVNMDTTFANSFKSDMRLEYQSGDYEISKDENSLKVTSTNKTCEGCDAVAATVDAVKNRKVVMTVEKTYALDPEKTYSTYNKSTGKYEKKGSKDDVGKIAISSKGESVGTISIIAQELGVNSKFVSNGKTQEEDSKNFNDYTCSYATEPRSCSQCFDPTTNQTIDICCLGNSADVLDKYCPNGTLSSEYGEQVKNVIKNYCYCSSYDNAKDVPMDDCVGEKMIEKQRGALTFEDLNNKLSLNSLYTDIKEAYDACMQEEKYKQLCSDDDKDYCYTVTGEKKDLTSCINSGGTKESCTEELCPSSPFYCVTETGEQRDITACIKEGGTVESCTAKICPCDPPCGQTYYCEKDPSINITNCVVNKYRQGQSLEDAIEACNIENCYFCYLEDGEKINLGSCLQNGGSEESCTEELCNTGDEPMYCSLDLYKDLYGDAVMADGYENIALDPNCIDREMAKGKSETEAKQYCEIDAGCLICPKNSTYHPGAVITNEMLESYGSLDNVIKNYCDYCLDCGNSYYCPKPNQNINITVCVYERTKFFGDSTAEARNYCEQKFCNGQQILVRPITLGVNPFLSTSTSANNTLSTVVRELDSNSNWSRYTQLKYLSKTQSEVYGSDQKPEVSITLTPEDQSKIKSDNRKNGYYGNNNSQTYFNQNLTSSQNCGSMFHKDC